jgi:hypothetical protein
MKHLSALVVAMLKPILRLAYYFKYYCPEWRFPSVEIAHRADRWH